MEEEEREGTLISEITFEVDFEEEFSVLVVGKEAFCIFDTLEPGEILDEADGSSKCDVTCSSKCGVTCSSKGSEVVEDGWSVRVFGDEEGTKLRRISFDLANDLDLSSKSAEFNH